MIEEANREIWAAVSRDIHRRAERARLRLLIASIDDLLWELEDLNLRDVRSVPRDLWEQIATVVASASGGRPEDVPVRRSIANALDVLFDTQARLIDERRELLGLVPQDVWRDEVAEEVGFSRVQLLA
jgi:hypothetical protein